MSQSINVNTIPDNSRKLIHVSQYDVGRTIKFKLFENSVAYTVPTGAAVKIQGTKPSGLGFSIACAVNGNEVTATTTAAMTQEWGSFPVELRITKDDDILGTVNFILDVEKSPHPENTTDGTLETIPELTARLDAYEQIFTADIAESVSNWLDEHPEATTTVQDGSITNAKLDSTLQGRISAVESGVSRNANDIDVEAVTRAAADEVLRQAIDDAAIVPAGSTVVVDSTLTISGAAADAKVTGDNFTDLKAETSDMLDSEFKITSYNKINGSSFIGQASSFMNYKHILFDNGLTLADLIDSSISTLRVVITVGGANIEGCAWGLCDGSGQDLTGAIYAPNSYLNISTFNSVKDSARGIWVRTYSSVTEGTVDKFGLIFNDYNYDTYHSEWVSERLEALSANAELTELIDEDVLKDRGYITSYNKIDSSELVGLTTAQIKGKTVLFPHGYTLADLIGADSDISTCALFLQINNSDPDGFAFNFINESGTSLFGQDLGINTIWNVNTFSGIANVARGIIIKGYSSATDGTVTKLGFTFNGDAVDTYSDKYDSARILDIEGYNQNKKWWMGKKIVWFGTSIPAGVAAAGASNGRDAYPNRVGNLLGATVYNEAVGSSCVCAGTHGNLVTEDNPMGFDDALKTFLSLSLSSEEKEAIYDEWDSKWSSVITGGSSIDWDNMQHYYDTSWDIKLAKYLSGGSVGQCDYYIFDHGFNDRGPSILDSPSDPDDRRYFYGAMSFLFKKILTDNPKARIVIVGHYSNTQTFNGGADRVELVCEAQESLANSWSFPLIKTWERMGFSTKTFTYNGNTTNVLIQWMPDGVHPSSDPTGEALKHYADVLFPMISGLR